MDTFLSDAEAFAVVRDYGSPVYVYSENILRQRCRDLLEAFEGRIEPSYSIKANSNIALLKIIKEEGLTADAMSAGEIFILEKAGFRSDEILYIGNNVSSDELRYCVDRGILVSVDSLSQLERLGSLNRGGRAAVRFNPGIGAGHCAKVITGGKKTKFGVDPSHCDEVRAILAKYDMKLVGVTQHIGSLFLDPAPYAAAAADLMEIVQDNFPGLEFIDFGGGFGVPYRPEENRLDFKKLTELLFPMMDSFIEGYDNKYIHFKCEPGRYVSAECGLLVGTVHALKENYGEPYIGTDIGFNNLMRPVLYGSHHELRHIKNTEERAVGAAEPALCCDGAKVVGNICESGDILADETHFTDVREGDLIAVENAGAYGYSMSSNYNCRLRPAEVLKTSGGELKLIRASDTLESLLQNF